MVRSSGDVVVYTPKWHAGMSTRLLETGRDAYPAISRSPLGDKGLLKLGHRRGSLCSNWLRHDISHSSRIFQVDKFGRSEKSAVVRVVRKSFRDDRSLLNCVDKAGWTVVRQRRHMSREVEPKGCPEQDG